MEKRKMNPVSIVLMFFALFVFIWGLFKDRIGLAMVGSIVLAIIAILIDETTQQNNENNNNRKKDKESINVLSQKSLDQLTRVIALVMQLDQREITSRTLQILNAGIEVVRERRNGTLKRGPCKNDATAEGEVTYLVKGLNDIIPMGNAMIKNAAEKGLDFGIITNSAANLMGYHTADALEKRKNVISASNAIGMAIQWKFELFVDNLSKLRGDKVAKESNEQASDLLMNDSSVSTAAFSMDQHAVQEKAKKAPSISPTQVEDDPSITISFGRYPHNRDNNYRPNDIRPIEWIELIRIPGKALLVSKYGLDSEPFNEECTEVKWQNCTLRKWLNGEFLQTAFNAEEQKMILDVDVTEDMNPHFDTCSGNSTMDKVFLLSLSEVNTYFSSDRDRQCYGTAYSKFGAVESSSGTCQWWLRSPCFGSYYASYVDFNGVAHKATFGNYDSVMNSPENAIRPSLWIKLNSRVFVSQNTISTKDSYNSIASDSDEFEGNKPADRNNLVTKPSGSYNNNSLVAKNDLVVPAGVDHIHYAKYRGKANLENVYLPEGIEKIYGEAFRGCTRLKSITLPNSLTHIGDLAFMGCTKLTSITLPNGITHIGDDVFNGCTGLTSVTLPDNLTDIGRRAFKGCTGLTSVALPNGLSRIGDEAFSGCTGLTKIKLPSVLPAFGARVFEGNDSLCHIYYDGKEKYCGKNFFGGSFPTGLIPEIKNMYQHMTTPAIDQYILNNDIWNMLDQDLQTEIFLSCQGKAMMQKYVKLVNKDLASHIATTLCDAIEHSSSKKNCNLAASFLLSFEDKIDIEQAENIYYLIKHSKDGAEAIKMINKANGS